MMMWAVTKVVIAVAFVVFGLQPIIEDMAGISLVKSINFSGGRVEPPQLNPSSIKHESVSKGRDYSTMKQNNADVSKVTSLVALPVGAGGGVWKGYFEAVLLLQITAFAMLVSLVLRGCKIRKQA